MINESRYRRLDLSGDELSYSWIIPDLRESVQRLWDVYAKEVYPHDGIVVGIRNQFFLKRISEFITPDSCIVVLPCGLTSYPYCAPIGAQFFECDLPELIDYKKARHTALQAEGVLPPRNIEYLAVDCTVPSQVQQLLDRAGPDRSRFFLIEGYSYYVEKNAWWGFVELIKAHMQPGDVIAFDYWGAEHRDEAIYKRFIQFCAEYASYELSSFNFLSLEGIQAAFGEGFEVLSSNVCDEELKFSGVSILENADEFMKEYYIVARKAA